MESAAYLLPLLGGFMMGTAALYLYLMLRDSPQKSATPDRAGRARSQLLVGFALGTLIGAYAVSRIVQDTKFSSIPMVILGAPFGVLLGYLFALGTKRSG